MGRILLQIQTFSVLHFAKPETLGMAFLFVNPFVLKKVYGLVCAFIVSLLPYLSSFFSCKDWSERVRQDSGR